MNIMQMRRGMGASGAPLPYDAKLEYVLTDGAEWYDLGIVPEGDDNIFECKFMLINAGNYGPIYRAYNGENNAAYRVIRNGSSGGIMVNCGTNGNRSSATSASLYQWLDTTLRYRYFTFNGTTQSIQYGQGGVPSGSMYIFASNVVAAFAGFKWTKGSTIIADIIPVRIGRVGYLYDNVSNKFLINLGTGSLQCGADIG